MANVTLNTSFNFLAAQDWAWQANAATASFLSISDGTHTQTFNGSFTYDNAGNVSGTVNSTSYSVSGVLVYTVTGLTAGHNSAGVLQQHAEVAGDTQETYAYVLGGNDAILGSTGNDTILGYAGNDTINGAGGADVMLGGAGNDSYVVNAAGDVVQETTTLGGSIDAGGTDTVLSSVSFSLSASTGLNFVERLSLTGSAVINGTGNALGNVLYGNSAANLLRGLGGNDAIAGGSGNDTLAGGLGNDVLTGGLGNDFFRFDTLPSSSTNRDRIADYNVSADTIQLENGVFTRLGTGTGAMNSAFFKSIATGGATDANDYIVYNHTTGVLYYDANGSTNGLADAVQLAVLAPNLALTAADFMLI